MKFEAASVHAIKSISQRGLTVYWQRLAGDRRFPTFQEFRPASRMHDPMQLAIWSVENTGGPPRFLLLYQGANVREALRSPGAGVTMDTVVPEPLRDFAMLAAAECAHSGQPIYTVLSTDDGNGHRIDCERLLLPFGADGRTVRQIVASLQLFSAKGNFQRATVLDRFMIGHVVTASVRINSSRDME